MGIMAETLYAIDKLIHSLGASSTSETTVPDKFASTELKDQEETISSYSDIDADDISTGAIKQIMRTFVSERDWEQFHTPRNILLALVGEIGELSEIFQWRGECKRGLKDWSDGDRTHLGEEMADCLLNLRRMADLCDVNLEKAVLD